MLERVRSGELDVADAIRALTDLPFAELGHSRIDHHRALRTGIPEVVYGDGKTASQIIAILRELEGREQPCLVTRVDPAIAREVCTAIDRAEHHEMARAIVIHEGTTPHSGRVAVVTGGTTDQPVAEEAALTCTVFGLDVDRIYDVGVAGLHRVVSQRDRIEESDAVIVLAGMEGALASVLAGLISKPVIAVPTSVGYGASFGGLAALLGMLSSCAPGVSVVNIDNGFGAACVAARMSRG